MERKKQFGLFSSIGTTKSQLIKTVYFEAIIISLIGIPLGILASYLGIGIVIKITNSLLNLGTNLLELTTYPLFIIIPIIFIWEYVMGMECLAKM
jgi:putative ABC transport system permease protein